MTQWKGTTRDAAAATDDVDAMVVALQLYSLLLHCFDCIDELAHLPVQDHVSFQDFDVLPEIHYIFS